MTFSKRISESADLGRDHRSIDLALGTAAILPIIGAGLDVWIAGADIAEVAALATEWSGGLLLFFAGVRRGLTFSEAGGGRSTEMITLFWLFGVGMATLILVSLSAAILGLVSVGLLDLKAAQKHEAPLYFRLFRPLQMVVASVALAAILIRQLTPIGV